MAGTHEHWEYLCPENRIDVMNHLMGARLLSMADLKTFQTLTHEDGIGRRYCWAGIQLEPAVSGNLLNSPVGRPAYNNLNKLDLAKANSARGLVSIIEALPETPPPNIPQVPLFYKGWGLAEAYGLTRIEEAV